jgi:hypothetical protein
LTVTPAYVLAIEQAYQGEVYGERLYAMIAGARNTPDHAYKWRALAHMEFETKHLMRRLVLRHGGNTAEDPSAIDKAATDFEHYGHMPWPDLMRAFSTELKIDIALYAELEYDGPPRDRWVLQRLTDHEVVIKRFCDLELAGRADISIDPVLQFCRRPPAR